MTRSALPLVVACALVAPLACNTTEDATEPPPTPGPFKDASRSETSSGGDSSVPTGADDSGADASTSTGPKPLECGSTQCTGTKKCCVTQGAQICTTDDCAGGYAFACFSNANCDPNYICCLVDKVATCSVPALCTGQGGQILCGTNGECGGASCEPHTCGPRTFSACPGAGDCTF